MLPAPVHADPATRTQQADPASDSPEFARIPAVPQPHPLMNKPPEIVTEHGGTPARTRVGHTFMKALMAERDAVFGGEHSGHYYFRDFWRADTGMLAALHVLAALGATDKPLSVLVAEYSRYVASGEINSEVADVPATLAAIEKRFDGAEPIGSTGSPCNSTAVCGSTFDRRTPNRCCG
jgi:hypothetical protein